MVDKGIVFNIQKFCVNDGPGIRTTVFLKGCNMRCSWCHNPESFRIEPQLFYQSEKCTGCRKCEEICPHQVHIFEGHQHHIAYENCLACGKCTKECFAQAIKIVGSEKRVQEIIEEIKKDKHYYEASNGGVTFSGGEASVQFEFLLSLVRCSRQEGIQVAIETNGAISPERLESLLPYADLFLVDYKVPPDSYEAYTGVSGSLVMKVLQRLAECEKPVILRCPIIPGINNDRKHYDDIRNIKENFCNITQVEIMPYHTTGVSKWKCMGMSYELKEVPALATEEKEQIIRYIEEGEAYGISFN